MSQNTIHKVIAVFHQAFLDLQVRVSMPELENMAVLVHRAMTLQTRHFHTLEHVFSFTSMADPIQTLAALFHDIVYYQVDEGFIPEIEAIIAPYIEQTEQEIKIISKLPEEDHFFELTLEIFQYSPGQELTSVNGLNEFLSSLVMVKLLQGFVSEQDLVRILVCIEATIPFQGKNEKGETHFDILSRRLASITQKYYLCLGDTEIEAVLQLAVTFSNKDVESFSDPDVGYFLDNTWKLLPETNVALRTAEIYSICEYRQALYKMERFFRYLNPDNVFNQYHNVPSDQEFQQMVYRTNQNVLIARDYLKIKLLAASILEALAEISGGDAPLSLFSGEVDSEIEHGLCYDNFVSLPFARPTIDQTTALYKLFYYGRPAETIFDLKTSPLSLFLYTSLSLDAINQLTHYAQQMFDGEIQPEEFLLEIPKPVITAIASACSTIVLTRRDKLLAFVSSL